MTGFQGLPTVLQDLVTDFAWKTKFKDVEQNITQLLMIKKLSLPSVFYKTYLYSTENRCHMYNPLNVYLPFWRYNEMFDVNSLRELLYTLDFRKRAVKRFGSRHLWLQSFNDHYLNIIEFGIFYKLLLSSKENVYTPTFNSLLKNGYPTRFWQL